MSEACSLCRVKFHCVVRNKGRGESEEQDWNTMLEKFNLNPGVRSPFSTAVFFFDETELFINRRYNGLTDERAHKKPSIPYWCTQCYFLWFLIRILVQNHTKTSDMKTKNRTHPSVHPFSTWPSSQQHVPLPPRGPWCLSQVIWDV